jgi:hypothetical protein
MGSSLTSVWDFSTGAASVERLSGSFPGPAAPIRPRGRAAAPGDLARDLEQARGYLRYREQRLEQLERSRRPVPGTGGRTSKPKFSYSKTAVFSALTPTNG